MLSFFITVGIVGQELPNAVLEQQLENVTESIESETEDDAYLQQLQQFKKYPLNLNKATENELLNFKWLSAFQIKNLLQYKFLLGDLVSTYELQAVPGWDIETIARILPFVTVNNNISIESETQKRFTGGDHSLLIRFGQVLEKSKGFLPSSDTTGPLYLGSRQRVLFRYKYQYSNQLQFGLLGDKDAGEPLFKGSQKHGFDFYSVHFFARNLGFIRRIAIGDFTVNMAQGLLACQSLAFGKSVDVLNIKRQAEVFRPYHSAGEFNFHRGAAITLGNDKLQVSAYVSYKKVDANRKADTTVNEDFVSSIITSGYHRTLGESLNRQSVNELGLGGRFLYRNKNLQLGANGIYYKMSRFLQKNELPYHLFSFKGNKLGGGSFDYSYTFQNVHLFGEAAADHHFNLAQVHGLMASLDSRVDFSLLYRKIAKNYSSLYANAFTESSAPVNESGFFTGLSIRPWGMIRLDLYADVYRFPWLRYRVDRPSGGSEYLFQLTWKPNKQVDLYTRYKSENKAVNLTSVGLPNHETENIPRRNWRTQVAFNLSQALTIRSRTEVVWYSPKGKNRETGFLIYGDCLYRPMTKPVSFNVRCQYFETGGFNSRLYAYENDVLYSYSIPVFSGRGTRTYLNVNYEVNKHLVTWFRIARTVYQDVAMIGSGNDQIIGNHKTDYRFQVLYSF